MKYLVNRETKYHKVLGPGMGWHPDHYDVVEADAEGWIKWDGGECPLPDDAHCGVKHRDGEVFIYARAGYGNAEDWSIWERHCVCDIIAYRPILDKPEENKKEPSEAWAKAAKAWTECLPFDDPRGWKPVKPNGDLIDRLKSAHEAAQSIPDLLAELREALGPELLRMLAEPENLASEYWAKGYLITCVNNKDMEDILTIGRVYQVARNNPDMETIVIENSDQNENEECMAWRFRFHSRP